MQQKSIISEVKEIGSSYGEELFFPQNRLLYVDQLTGFAPDSDFERQSFSPRTREDVYEHYQPSKERLSIYNEEGDLFYEDFHFSCIKDFDDEKLIEQSPIMSLCDSKMSVYRNMIQQLERNRGLKNILMNSESKEALITCLKHIRNELNSQPQP